MKKSLKDYLSEAEYASHNPVVGDYFDLVIDELSLLESEVVELVDDGVIIAIDEAALDILFGSGMLLEHNGGSAEPSYDFINKKVSDNALVELDGEVDEAEYHGRDVPLGKPMAGDVKKSKVYVKNPKTGKVIKVNFGDKTMRIKKTSPKHRKSFRARHNCANPGPRTKARYWSCRAW
jgi:hypothetical protein